MIPTCLARGTGWAVGVGEGSFAERENRIKGIYLWDQEWLSLGMPEINQATFELLG